MYKVLLVFFMLMGIGFAFYSVITQQVMRAVFAMFACFFCISASLVFLNAEYLAISHLMVYVGGIIVVMVFAILLSSPSLLEQLEEKTSTLRFTRIVAALFALGLFLALLLFIRLDYVKFVELEKSGTVKELAFLLLGRYGMLIELVSITLLVALMGVYLVDRKGGAQNAQ